MKVGTVIKRMLLIAALSFAPVSADAGAPKSHRDSGSCDFSKKEKLADVCDGGFGAAHIADQQILMDYSPNLTNMIVESANNNGVDPRLALAVAGHESGLNACAGSPTGVLGPMQLTQGTAREFGLDRNILSENIEGGMLVLKRAVDICGGTTNSACLAKYYNGSPTPGEQKKWAKGVEQRFAQMNRIADADMHKGCKDCKPVIQNDGIPAPSESDTDIDVDSVPI